jgi:hypothetical protein
MPVISEARISPGFKRVIAGVVCLACLFTISTTLLSNFLFVGVAIATVVLLLTWFVLNMRVTVETANSALLVRCRPFYSKAIPLEDIVDVSPAPSSSVTEGFGIRYLGRRTWGLLVGGPAITIETPTRTWVLSTPEPEATTAAIRALTAPK